MIKHTENEETNVLKGIENPKAVDPFEMFFGGVYRGCKTYNSRTEFPKEPEIGYSHKVNGRIYFYDSKIKDYVLMLDEPKIIDKNEIEKIFKHITGDQMSCPYLSADIVIEKADECINESIKKCKKDYINALNDEIEDKQKYGSHSTDYILGLKFAMSKLDEYI